MKTLLLMRHAKSSHYEVGVSDFDRPLNERGKADAPEMGKRLLKKLMIPDIIVSSPAKRALKTAKLVAEQIGYDEKKIDLQSDIYEADIADLVHVIRSLDDKYEIALIFGHNPGFTGLVGYLTNTFIENLPTSGIAAIQFDMATWKQISSGKGTTLWIDYPKSLHD